MDIDYLLLLQSLREATGGIFNTFFELVTRLGETSYVMLLIGIVYRCMTKERAYFFCLRFTPTGS